MEMLARAAEFWMIIVILENFFDQEILTERVCDENGIKNPPNLFSINRF